MPIDTIEFRGSEYPSFQSTGFAAKFIFPFALEVCKGVGYDIGCNRKDWILPGAIGIDPTLNIWLNNSIVDAYNLPEKEVDYIFSSHCLEHLRNWVEALDYWTSKLKFGGVLFLYLPHPDQTYWRPFHNRKHIHSLSPELIESYLMESGNYSHTFVSQRDLNHSFAVMAQKI